MSRLEPIAEALGQSRAFTPSNPVYDAPADLGFAAAMSAADEAPSISFSSVNALI